MAIIPDVFAETVTEVEHYTNRLFRFHRPALPVSAFGQVSL